MKIIFSIIAICCISGLFLQAQQDIIPQACDNTDSSGLKGSFLSDSGLEGEYCDGREYASPEESQDIKKDKTLNNLKSFLDSSQTKNNISTKSH